MWKLKKKTAHRNRVELLSLVYGVRSMGDAGQRIKAFSWQTKSTDVLMHDMQMKAYN